MMSTLAGVVIALLVLVTSYTRINILDVITGDRFGLVLIVGGTVSATVITYGFKEVMFLLRAFSGVFKAGKYTNKDVVKELIDISKLPEESRFTSKGKDYHITIVEGLEYIGSGFDSEGVQKIISNSVKERASYYLKAGEMLKTLSKYPTAFGMMGTVLGLVALLKNLDLSSGSMPDIGPNMSVALLTTLYGLVISNWFFMPCAENLFFKAKKDFALNKIIITGLDLIQRGEDSLYIQETLNSYLPLDQRVTETA